MSTPGEWTQLGPHEALTMGADLWIIAGLADSAWARKIDWYLNFQLSRASQRARREISPELAATSESWEFDPPVIASRADAPLLIASAKLLPNQITVQIPGSGSSWIEAALKSTLSLKPRAVRVFVPNGLDLHEFSRLWTLAGSSVAVVLDQDPRSH